MSEPGTVSPTAPILSVDSLRKVHQLGRGSKRYELVAVDDVSFTLDAGGTMALVGESGSGKSTCVRLVVGLEHPTSGSIQVNGVDAVGLAGRQRTRRQLARDVQMVFQDPYSSLDPRQKIGAALAEVIRFHGNSSSASVPDRVRELLDLVGLDWRLRDSVPRTLSGGQRQRVAIARALAANPRLLILDEAVAALDVSIQAQILAVLRRVRESTGVALLFITHDLAVAELMCDRVLVMRRGRIVEEGLMADVLENPSNAYTRDLLRAVPRRGWKPTRRSQAVSEAEEGANNE